MLISKPMRGSQRQQVRQRQWPGDRLYRHAESSYPFRLSGHHGVVNIPGRRRAQHHFVRLYSRPICSTAAKASRQSHGYDFIVALHDSEEERFAPTLSANTLELPSNVISCTSLYQRRLGPEKAYVVFT